MEAYPLRRLKEDPDNLFEEICTAFMVVTDQLTRNALIRPPTSLVAILSRS